MTEVQTERLVLRRFSDADRAPFAELNADPVVMEHFPSTLTRAESDQLVDQIDAVWDERGWGPWAVVVAATGEFVGEVGLLPADHVAVGAVEVGWRVARGAWGRGYAPEAASAALGVGFEGLGLDEDISFTVPQNAASRRVMEKIGMQHRPERDFEHPRVDAATSPHLKHHVLYSISRAEWAGRAEWERQATRR